MGRPGWDGGRRPANPVTIAALVAAAVLVIVVTFAVFGR